MRIVKGDSNTVGIILNLDELATLTGLLAESDGAERAAARQFLMDKVAEGSTYVHSDPNNDFYRGLRQVYSEMLAEVRNGRSS